MFQNDGVKSISAKLVLKTNKSRISENDLFDNTTRTSSKNEVETITSTTFSSEAFCIGVMKNEETSTLGPELPLRDEVEEPPKAKDSTINLATSVKKKALSSYEVEKFRKNAIIIFNHEHRENNPREGTHVDVEALKNTFDKFGFEVNANIHHDLEKSEIINKLKEFTSRDFTEYGCIVVVILTHGSILGRLKAKDRSYNESEIIAQLGCDNKTLENKPKLVFIEACRGKIKELPVPVFFDDNVSRNKSKKPTHYRLKLGSHMLVAHSSSVGKQSFLHRDNGSWFIKTLCETIDQLTPVYDLDDILTNIQRRVAIDFTEKEYPMNQMINVDTTLVKKIYFKKFNDVLRA